MNHQTIIILAALLFALIVILIGFLFYIRNQLNQIRTDIKNSIIPKFVEFSPDAKSLAELGLSFWRLEQKLIRHFQNNQSDEVRNIENHLSKLKRYLDTNDLEICDLTGKAFNDSLNIDVISVVKEESMTRPIIKETIEPSILLKGTQIKKAKVILSEGK